MDTRRLHARSAYVMRVGNCTRAWLTWCALMIVPEWRSPRPPGRMRSPRCAPKPSAIVESFAMCTQHVHWV